MTGSSLANRSILIPFETDVSRAFITSLELRGGIPLTLPQIAFVDPPAWDDVDRAIHHLADYHGILFMDRHAVEFFLKRIHSLDPGRIRSLAACRIFAIGDRTEEYLFDAGLASAVVPRTSTSLDLESLLARAGVWQRKYLFPHGSDETESLTGHVRALGGFVDEIVVYQQKMPEPSETDRIRKALLKRQISATVFLSPSSAQSAVSPVGRDALSQSVIAAIGPSTSEAVRNVGLTPRIIPGRAAPEALVDALEQYFITSFH